MFVCICVYSNTYIQEENIHININERASVRPQVPRVVELELSGIPPMAWYGMAWFEAKVF